MQNVSVANTVVYAKCLSRQYSSVSRSHGATGDPAPCKSASEGGRRGEREGEMCG